MKQAHLLRVHMAHAGAADLANAQARKEKVAMYIAESRLLTTVGSCSTWIALLPWRGCLKRGKGHPDSLPITLGEKLSPTALRLL